MNFVSAEESVTVTFKPGTLTATKSGGTDLDSTTVSDGIISFVLTFTSSDSSGGAPVDVYVNITGVSLKA
jgi:hypothetical protein